MPLFEGVLNFVRRHRRKIVIVGIVVGGAALLKRYADRKFQEWADSERVECLERLKREQHFESTRSTCRTTVVSLIHNLKDRILIICDCESLTDRIKERPANRLELWETLKRLSFARLVVQVYGSALLVTLLNVQLNIIGGYMFVDAMNANSSDDSGLATTATVTIADSDHRRSAATMTRTVQQRYLTVVEDFLRDGVLTLTTFVQSAVDDVIGDVSLKEKLTVSKIQDFFAAIQDVLDVDTVDNISSVLGLTRTTSDNQHGSSVGSSPHDDHTLARVIDETSDLMESDDCRKVLALTVKAGFSVVADALVDSFAMSSAARSASSASASSSSSRHALTSSTHQDAGFLNPNEISLPLAHVIPMVSDIGRRLLNSGGDLSDQLLSSMFALETQQVIAANIYESFSQRCRATTSD